MPIDGVGFQLRTLPSAFNRAAVTATMAGFSRLGVETAVTELDVPVGPPFGEAEYRRQAAVYGQALAACLAANCHTFVTWGFTDRYSWIPQRFAPLGAALPFDADLAPKQAALTLQRELGRAAGGDGGGR